MEQLKTSLPDRKNGQRAMDDNSQPTEDATLDLTPLLMDAAFVPETTRIDNLLTEFKRRRQQMTIVVDEYGSTAGLITMADLLEQVFGDMPDETDAVDPGILQRPDGRLQVAGRVRIDEVNDLYGLGFSTDDADTMAGLVLIALNRTASAGDEVEINGIHIRVEEVDRHRIVTLSLSSASGAPLEHRPGGDGML
jgi:CBS domain containing-hemolysin-like protein